MPTKPRQVHYVIWSRNEGYKQGFLIRAGKFVKETVGRLKHDPSPWAHDVARIFQKNPQIEEMTVMDDEGYLHSYYRERL